MKKFISILLLLLVNSGCVSIIDIKPIQTYTLNEVQTATIGNPILVSHNGTVRRVKHWVGYLNSHDGWKITDNYSLDYLRKELIYSGISDQTIKISYKEYRGGYAAPAFFQEVQYDLSKSKVIKFQNFEFEIIKAGNSDITFKVTKDF